MRISANNLTECPTQLLSLPKLAWFAFSGNPFSHAELNIVSVPSLKASSFALHNVLGQGASGVISRATWHEAQTEYPHEVAVKVFKGSVTSDGYPKDELQACLKTGSHKNIVRSLAQVNENGYLALIMVLIPEHFKNLGLPPTFDTCTRDTFPSGFTLKVNDIDKIITQMEAVFEHLHSNQVCHGDLYAHNTLFDDNANIIFGDFGAATMYHMLDNAQQALVKNIERRALNYFIKDLLTICHQQDQHSPMFRAIEQKISRNNAS